MSELTPFLTRQQLVSADDCKRDVVDVPEWGGRVCIRGLTGAEYARVREAWRKEDANTGDNLGTPDSITCGYGLVDEKGANLFTVADMPLLTRRNPAVLGRLARMILKLSGVIKEESAAIEGN